MASLLAFMGIAAGAVGIFFGFFYSGEQPELALRIVTFAAVGVVGVLAFVRHVFFYRQDMVRLGWKTDRPDWIFEVGFANLAFGAAGIAASLLKTGSGAVTVVLGGYGFYLLQASLLHGYRYFTGEKKSAARLWRSFITTLLYACMIGYFTIMAVKGY